MKDFNPKIVLICVLICIPATILVVLFFENQQKEEIPTSYCDLVLSKDYEMLYFPFDSSYSLRKRGIFKHVISYSFRKTFVIGEEQKSYDSLSYLVKDISRSKYSFEPELNIRRGFTMIEVVRIKDSCQIKEILNDLIQDSITHVKARRVDSLKNVYIIIK